MAKDASHLYNNPNTVRSSIDDANSEQMNVHYYNKKALMDAKRKMYFMPLADTTTMPKHFGKEIRAYHYIPLLDDRNTNDEGIDANGADLNSGNLYGSSKDIGTITSKLPTLSETGGRVNRVGFTRKLLKGSISKLGFFTEYSQESIDFDSDAQLMMHVTRELVEGASQISEDVLQRDLLMGAGTTKYVGAATDLKSIGHEVVTYDDLFNLSIDLDNNRTPKQTKVITGSRMIDTKTIRNGRVMYIGTELQLTIEKMKDNFDKQAFIPVNQYGYSGTILNGEVGSINHFRIVVVPEMQHWEGKPGKIGAVANTDQKTKYRVTTAANNASHFNVYPMLVVGDQSFTSIGFQTGGKGVKWRMIHKKPGKEVADRQNPYGEIGFHSIKWWYGTMILRPERLAVIHTSAQI